MEKRAEKQASSRGVFAGALHAFALAVGLACIVACAGLAAPVAYGADAGLRAAGPQAADYDTSWYDGKESPYTIADVKQLKGLAYLVNSGKDAFEGKEIRLAPPSGRIVFIDSMNAVDPIGSAEHPFKGTFDGNSAPISNLKLNVGNRLSNIGLFGYADGGAAIKNVTLQGGSFTVLNSENGRVISNVGAIAGYLEGTLQSCSSSLDVSVTNNGTVPAKKGETAEELCTITYIGGLVGHIVGDMSSCVRDQSELNVESSSNVTENVPFIAGYVGGIAGYQGDEANVSFVPNCENCSNKGSIAMRITGSGGIDRFGQATYSKSTMVGGVVGYATGNVTLCSNTAVIQTGVVQDGKVQAGWGASTCGGIVGSLRGPTVAEAASATGIVGSNETDPGYTHWTESNGASEPATLVVQKCQNSGDVTGLASVAGICGTTGAFTRIVASANTGKIEGTRWNKPCPAGIVGISNGDIAYCYNQGRCFSTTGGGYYSSGIAALLTTYNTSRTADALKLDEPEIYGCYVTGSIGGALTNYKTAVIAGENDGFIHDNCFLPNLTVDKVKDEAVFGDSKEHSRIVSEGGNRGTLANNHELTATEMRTGLAVTYLNRINAVSDEWETSYVSDDGSFPVLKWQHKDFTDPANLDGMGITVQSVDNPPYSAAKAPIPSVKLVASNGATLYQNRDFKVVVREDAKQMNTTYAADVEGINAYVGKLDGIVSYQIGKANMGTCTVSAGYVLFNWERQVPTTDQVVVRDDLGDVVDPSEYEVDVPANEDENPAMKGGKYHDYVYSHGVDYQYDVTVTAVDSSEHYTGSTTQPAFQIKPASLFYSVEDVDDPNKEESVDLGNVVWNGETWPAKDAIKTKGHVKIKYTGGEIKPTYDSVKFAGRELRNGTGVTTWYMAPYNYDYKYVYGNPNPEEGKDASATSIDATGSGERELACMTIRFSTSGSFENYTNMFYEITPASISDDVNVEGIEPSYIYPGKPVTVNPVLTYNGMTLVQGTDYTLSYTDNDKAGMASVTITGKGNYEGSTTRVFAIKTADIALATATVGKQVYDGAPLQPNPHVVYEGNVLKNGTDYAVSYTSNSKPGTAMATIQGKGGFAGSKTIEFAIEKGSQTLKASNKTVKLKSKKLKAKKQTVNVAKLAKVSGGRTSVTYSGKANKKSGKFKVSKSGVLTVKKKTPKGTYKIKMVANAQANAFYNAAPTRRFTVTVKIK